jgi:uncharacterized protein YciI
MANSWAPLLTDSAQVGASLWRGGNAMTRWFAVLRARGPNWDRATPLRQQKLWDEHATFTDGLEAEGLIRLAGPLDGSNDVLLIVRGESAEAVEARLAQDPWTPAGMLHTAWIRPWNVLVGTLD